MVEPREETPVQVREIEIRFLPDGTVETDWWTPEAGDILCGICGGCPGHRSPDVDRRCPAGNPWCG
jgi:hypothetical protein